MELIEVTPEHLRCGLVEECPAAFLTSDGETAVFIGERFDGVTFPEGSDLCAIVLDPDIAASVLRREGV